MAAQREPTRHRHNRLARFDIQSSTMTISLAGHVLNANAWRRGSLVGVYFKVHGTRRAVGERME